METGLESAHATYDIRSPDRITYGLGSVGSLGEFAEKQAIETALIVTDATLVEVGTVEKPIAALESAGVTTEVFDEVQAEPTLKMANDAAEAVVMGDHDLVVGIGGGSSMDTAKVAAGIADTSKGARDVLGMDKVSDRTRKLALLPTTAGTGSETTHIGVFADEDDGGTKKVIYADPLFADLAVVDPELTATLPGPIAAQTGVDALTHAIEAYVSTKRTPYTDTLARSAIERIGENLRPAVFQGEENDGARYQMSLAAMQAGQAFVNSGLGAVHALTYPLSREYHLGHGLTNGLLLPYVMAYNVPAERNRFSDIARWLEPDDSMGPEPMESVEAVFRLLDDVGIPTDIAGYGDLDSDDFDRFADIAFEQSKHNIERNPRTLDRSDVIAIFENAYTGEY
ncbi:Alcohol dehydrogenase, class IV [Halanaeroarchaeum sp. HSR-CO]|uniref:iron-containing alcohol dehydrogenase family protein n=1 Tax=Halanaeroarchaeum sp. HSR-CO TaxID=2866382 RepID=UPI00217EDA70|nr:iron-containing alcohol dehydrogenase [Halanaeroarchaeum sp. HSR-CO]UWG47083.1 Alcohol dehydrogenase, class IV [Halanaeroarchaeum sp. HSR-CO]